MTDERRRHRMLGGETREAILAVLTAAARPMGVDELARAVGRHPNTLREQLEQLIDADLVERRTAPAAGRGRPAHRYLALPTAAPSDGYRSLAAVLADEIARLPDPSAASVSAGQRWGSSLAEGLGTRPAGGDPSGTATAVDRLIGILDAAGFAPERPATEGDPLRLRRCPFEPVARSQPGIVCGVHLGMIRGALERLDAGLDIVRLEPFVTPDVCLAHLAVAPKAAP